MFCGICNQGTTSFTIFFQMTEKEMQHLFLSLVYYLAFYFTYLVFYIISKLAFMSNEFSYIKWQERGGRSGY